LLPRRAYQLAGQQYCFARIARNSAVVARVMLSLPSRTLVVGDPGRVSALRAAHRGSPGLYADISVWTAKRARTRDGRSRVARNFVPTVAGRWFLTRECEVGEPLACARRGVFSGRG
jgi:hypothetical protein